jgi:hypothetical protein
MSVFTDLEAIIEGHNQSVQRLLELVPRLEHLVEDLQGTVRTDVGQPAAAAPAATPPPASPPETPGSPVQAPAATEPAPAATPPPPWQEGQPTQ